MRRTALFLLLFAVVPVWGQPPVAHRHVVPLEETNPYYPHREFPRLTTPMWVGEEGVEAVVILGIDDMRDPKRYEAYLRPILNRLKKIDGRAPVSIMTCKVEPNDAQLQAWRKEGLSLECHTVDHPCPYFKIGFARGKDTFDRCVDLLASVPDNRPVAFRVPCCDSLNTPSPRLYAEIFAQTTAKGNHLAIDTSVFNVFTAADPELPRDLVLDAAGKERFLPYFPPDRSFVNWIANYPYPYVIGRSCWQFPCATPSDWEAQHRHGKNNPLTVQDWKRVLDCTVIKQGVFCLVFHPHGWIQAEQVAELIDHAQEKHGKKVKFLTFAEALDRLNRHLLDGHPLRSTDAVRLADLNRDGYLDVLLPTPKVRKTRLWQPATRSWKDLPHPVKFALRKPAPGEAAPIDHVLTSLEPKEGLSVVVPRKGRIFVRHFRKDRWVPPGNLPGIEDGPDTFAPEGGYPLVPFLLRDLDGDGRSELVMGDAPPYKVLRWAGDAWAELPFALPENALLPDAKGRDRGLRLVDLNGDGKLDLVHADDKTWGIYLFADMKTGWRMVRAGKQGEEGALPPIARGGTDNGFWVHSGHFWWSNEDTAALKDHVDRRKITGLMEKKPAAAAEPVPLSPQEARAAFRPRPGFVVELMAAEPLVRDPIAFAFGPDGKFWVVEMGDYPLGAGGANRPGGRVKFLEKSKPQDAAAPFDKATVFLDGLSYPTGVWPWKKGVLVTCAPDIFYAEDSDADGKADRKEVLFTGFREGNQQHRVNGFAYGLDNWLYGANGDSGGTVRSAKTGKTWNIAGRDFRLRPEEGRFDPQTGQTQFGRHRDDWGNWFGNNNSNPMFHYVLDDRYLRRNPFVAYPSAKVQVSEKPGAAPVFPVSKPLPRFNNPQSVNHFTSACSAFIYRDDFLGPEYAGNSFVSEPVHNLIHREIVTPRGATFTSRRADDERTSEFLASTDNWFRPAMIAAGPDGCLWVADMYRLVIEHPEWIPKDWQKKLDLRAGHDRGRIWRVRPKDKTPRTVPHLSELDSAALVRTLESPSGLLRDLTQQMLVERRDDQAVPLLARMAAGSKSPQARLHALCTLDGLGKVTDAVLRRALADEHPGVRQQAVRVAESYLAKNDDLGPLLAKSIDDADPQVRLQLAYTLRMWQDPRAGELLGMMAARHADDPYLAAAVMSSATKENWEPLVQVVESHFRGKEVPRHLVDPLIALAHAHANEAGLARLLVIFTRTQKGRSPADRFLTLAGLFDLLERKNSSPARLWQGLDEKTRADLQRHLTPILDTARKTAADDRAPLGTRTAAIRLLARGEDAAPDLDLLAGLVHPRLPDDVQGTALDRLARGGGARGRDHLLGAFKSLSPSLRQRVLEQLLSRPEGTQEVLAALESKRILLQEIDAAHRQRLLTAKDVALRKRAEAILAAGTSRDRAKVIDDYRRALSLKGAADAGSKVFARVCAACHKLGEVGQQVGPDLASVGDKSPEGLLAAVLDPNRAVEARYLNFLAVTRAGTTHAGLIAEETSTSVTMIGADGKRFTLLRGDLEELTGTGKSTMPEGLEKDLSHQDFANLLAFLQGALPRPMPKKFALNRPAVVRPDAQGRLRLDAVQAEIYGPSLILEEKYRNLGYWSSPEDHAIWKVDLPRAGKYRLVLDQACANAAAGNLLLVEASGALLEFRVKGTGTWEDYRTVAIGTLNLPAGRSEIVMRARPPLRGPLVDLRTAVLEPAGK